MKIIKPSVTIMTPLDQRAILEHIESCGRTCYKSEDRITEGSAEKFIRNIINRGHESVLEHFSITVRFVCDRGVTHEIVRHRLASYSQESTRYANYSQDKFGNEITVIKPCYLDENEDLPMWLAWKKGCEDAESAYMRMLMLGATPQEARAVLPNSLKTEICMTANIREWRTVLRQRTSVAAHPQIREVMMMLLEKFNKEIPVFFEDIVESSHGEA